MNKIGIQTIGLGMGIGATEEYIDNTYKMLSEVGFDCVDFNFDEYLNTNDVNAGIINHIFEGPVDEVWKKFKPHADAAKKYGITFEQMHAPFPMIVRDREDITDRMFDIIVKTFEICHRMGGKYIVVHPVTLSYDCSKDEELERNLSIYKRMIPYAKESNVVICLENLFLERQYHLMEGFGSDIREAVSVIDELNNCAGEELFGFCFDVGHANILGKNMYQSILTLGDHLKILHIHDNDGVSDLHTMPYTFMRSWAGLSTDWEGFLRGLREIGYKGVLNFETNRCLMGFPKELHVKVLELLKSIGDYFNMKIN